MLPPLLLVDRLNNKKLKLGERIHEHRRPLHKVVEPGPVEKFCPNPIVFFQKFRMPDDQRPFFIRPHPNAMTNQVTFLAKRLERRPYFVRFSARNLIHGLLSVRPRTC